MSENTCSDVPSWQGEGDLQFSQSLLFMGCKRSRDFVQEDIDVVISGVPYDQSTTGRPGARFGPASIRNASANLAWELRRWPWDFSVGDEA